MSVGGIGCISTAANIIPAEYHQMTTDFLKGRYKSAAKSQLAMIPLIRALFKEVNPIPVKAALNIMGYIEREYRLPMCEPSNEDVYKRQDLRRVQGDGLRLLLGKPGPRLRLYDSIQP